MGTKSSRLYREAQRLIPGGVNSPVRAARSVGIDPLFIESAHGCHVRDVDGNEYIDYVGSWGPMILGHRHPDVIQALEYQLQNGTSYGAPTELEIRMARTLAERVPSVEMVRMVNSGTEATMSAVRLARGYTGRDKIIKFDGCYHGHVDSLLVSAGSGVATLGIPGSPGVPVESARKTLSLPYNDLEAVRNAFARYPDEIAAVILEPVAGNMGVVLPKAGFLEGLRDLTTRHGALLIFDEVITGFRVARGGAQEYYGVVPDLTCMGKIIGGGLPVGAFGGKAEIMSRMAPQGDIYQAGTLSGNPLAMAAGLATLQVLANPAVYAELTRKGELFFRGLQEAAQAAHIPTQVNFVGPLGTLFFTENPVTDFAAAQQGNAERFRLFYNRMLAQGVYLAPSAFEAIFISTAHSTEVIEKTIDCAARTFASMP